MLLHWEGDENGGMDRFMSQAKDSELVGSALSIGLNASGFGLHTRTRGFRDGDTLDLGVHKLRFMETPHVHHWDSMMVVEETTRSVFPSDLYLQPGEQPAVTRENLARAMLLAYRSYGIFAHEDPVRAVARRIAELNPPWIHAMHGATIAGEALPYYTKALLEERVRLSRPAVRTPDTRRSRSSVRVGLVGRSGQASGLRAALPAQARGSSPPTGEA